MYYAKFSNTYLSEIAFHGANFRQNSKKCVTLHRSRKYYMRSTAHRVDFFKDYAKLLWYLTSGKAHVGYLFDYGDNPLYEYVLPTFLLLMFLGSGKAANPVGTPNTSTTQPEPSVRDTASRVSDDREDEDDKEQADDDDAVSEFVEDEDEYDDAGAVDDSDDGDCEPDESNNDDD